jgi:hypothetical protein
LSSSSAVVSKFIFCGGFRTGDVSLSSPRNVGEVRVISNTTVSRGSAGNLEHHSK